MCRPSGSRGRSSARYRAPRVGDCAAGAWLMAGLVDDAVAGGVAVAGGAGSDEEQADTGERQEL